MAKLINTTQHIGDDPWHLVGDEQSLDAYAIISLSRWQQQRDELLAQAKQGQLGILLNSDETADQLAQDAELFALICVNFPKFSDGRGYSTARLLRQHYSYKGELQACGDVLIDQLFYMRRCGFSRFALRDDQELEDALTAFSTFSVAYQSDVNDPRPLFRRRS